MSSDIERLDRMVEELRSIRTRSCESEEQREPRYLRLSNAVSALLWIVDDLRQEQGDKP